MVEAFPRVVCPVTLKTPDDRLSDNRLDTNPLVDVSPVVEANVAVKLVVEARVE